MPGLGNERGSVAVETLFFLAIFVVAFFGAIELAQGVALKHALDTGTYRAARYLSLQPEDWGGAESLVRQEVAGAVLGGDPEAVTVSIDMPGTAFGVRFTVRSQMPFQAAVPLVPGLSGRVLRAEHGMMVERYP